MTLGLLLRPAYRRMSGPSIRVPSALNMFNAMFLQLKLYSLHCEPFNKPQGPKTTRMASVFPSGPCLFVTAMLSLKVSNAGFLLSFAGARGAT